MRIISLIVLGCLIVACLWFEINPVIEYERRVVPQELYVGKDCGCKCIQNARPWYSTVNYWGILFLCGIPLLVFSSSPHDSSRKHIARTIAALSLGYIVIVLTISLFLEIRNGPFWVTRGVPDQPSWDMECSSYGSGAKRIFALYFGWLHALIYTGIWMMAWRYYHQRFTQQIDGSFKWDWLSLFTAKAAKGIITFAALLIVLLTFANFAVAALEKLRLIGWYKNLL